MSRALVVMFSVALLNAATAQIQGPTYSGTCGGLNVGVGAGCQTDVKLYSASAYSATATVPNAIWGDVYSTATSGVPALYAVRGAAFMGGSGTGTQLYGGWFQVRTDATSSATLGYGVYTDIPNTASLQDAVGTRSYAAAGTSTAFGLDALATAGVNSATTKYGVRAQATGTAGQGSTHYGINAGAAGAVNNYGAWCEATQSGTNAAYGVYAKASPSATGLTYMSGTVTSSYAGWFNGHVWVNNLLGVSDARLKLNVKPINGALSSIGLLSAHSYEFDHAKHPSMVLSEGLQFGVLAQELETVFPNLVTNTSVPDQYDSAGNLIEAGFDLKGVNYLGLIPVLIAGIQEQQAIVADKQAQLDNKQTQIDALTARLDKLETVVAGEKASVEKARR